MSAAYHLIGSIQLKTAVIHWETTLVVEDLDLTVTKLRQGGYQLLSAKIAEFTAPILGFKRAFLVRDPDGHVLRIVQR